MFDLKTYIKDHREKVNQALEEYLRRDDLSSRMVQPMEYALLGDGKRIRPILCLSTCSAMGDPPEKAMAAACALEMIHAYSLIHDDLPALDDDALRRGRPTCHIQFDEATAILTGDALLTMAFEILAEKGLSVENGRGRQWLRVIHIIGHAAGPSGMVEGQARDLAFEGHTLDQNQLEKMHSLKTGALIRAAVISGGLIGNADENQLMHLTVYAERIGLAFQVMDDILNVTGDPERMGKAVGTDSERRKNTYPLLMGLPRAIEYADDLIRDSLQALSHFDTKADPLRAIARYIVERHR